MDINQLDELIQEWLDGRIDQQRSDELQQRLRDSSSARSRFRELTKLDAGLRELSDDTAVLASSPSTLASPSLPPRFKSLMIAACLLLVGLIGFQAGQWRDPWAAGRENGIDRIGRETAESEPPAEETMAGYASLRRIVGVSWPPGSTAFRQGDVLPAGEFKISGGIAEIDFFSGASVVLEGPANLSLQSDWQATLLSGKMRANVPPVAQGFVVRVNEVEVIDLGTEFTLEVTPEQSRLEVVDGEVELRGGAHDGVLLDTGQVRQLSGSDSERPLEGKLLSMRDVERRVELERIRNQEVLEEYRQTLRVDERLIAYFVPKSGNERTLQNLATTGAELDGRMVGAVTRVPGRFAAAGPSGLGFGRPGSRVRTRIDGEFSQLTLACWVRIDSLQHLYNALFMSDGYENGELHWQIREDGKMMFSVMVDDTPGAGHGPRKDARLHHIYFTEPIWTTADSGQWFHLAAVYDPIAGQVSQYVNGRQISSEIIEDEFHVTELRIGAAEIGNWGQPLRESAWFAIRNLNGVVDEVAIFDAALSGGEIAELHSQGKPPGY